MYISPGPVVGDHTIAALRTWVGPGPLRTAPTRIGTPIAAAAASTVAREVGSWVGSRSEEFSGQMTAAGLGSRPAATSAASTRVSARWLKVTARFWANS